MIQPGIPNARADWPAGLLDHLAKFRQGDVVAGFPTSYLGDPDAAVHAQTAAYRDQGVGTIHFDDFPYGMIASQTCDIREEISRSPQRPWILVAPVYDGMVTWLPDGSAKERSTITSNIRRMLEAGGGPTYLLYLPSFPESGFWVADLRLLAPVEKGWLLSKEPISPFSDRGDQEKVAGRFALLFDRPAFDDRFELSVIRPLRTALTELKERDPELMANVWNTIPRIAVMSDDIAEMTYARVVVLAHADPGDAVQAWLDSQAEAWQAAAAESGLTLLPTETRTLSDLPTSDYLKMTTLPLPALAPDPTDT